MSDRLSPVLTRSQLRGMAVATAAAILAASAIASVPAWAHASPISRFPADGAVLSFVPTSARIVFSEPVTGGAYGLSVVNARGHRYSSIAKYSGATVTAALSGLSRGRYAVMYHVTSDDGHVVARASGFSIQVPDPAATRTMLQLNGQSVGLSGARVGTRTLTMPWSRSIGEVSWQLPGVEEPFVWLISGGKATGMLPFAGTYRLTIKAYTSATSSQTLTGRVRIR